MHHFKLLIVVAFTCAAAAPVLAAGPSPRVTTPNQYFLPFDTPTTDPKAKGLSVVNAADFTDVRVIEPTAVVSNVMTHFTGTVNATAHTFTNAHPHSLVYAKAGRWYYVDLKATSSLAPLRISSETSATKVCAARLIDIDVAHPTMAYLLYQLPGADAVCNAGGDDQFRAAHLSDRGTVAPIVLPVTTLGDMYSIGNLETPAQAVVARDGSTVRLFNSALTSSQVVFTGLTSGWGTAGRLGSDSSFIFVNDSIRPLSSSGTLGAAVFTSPAGFCINHFNYGDANNTYFLAHKCTDQNVIKLYRVPRDGTTAATLMLDAVVANGSDIEAQTTNSILLRQTVPGGEKLIAVAKTAAAGAPAPVIVDSITTGLFRIAFASGTRVYYTASTFTTGGVVNSARSRLETGTGARNAGNGSSWLGYEISGVKYENATYAYGLLATGAGTANLNGAVLSSYRLSDATTTALTTLTVPAVGAFEVSFGQSGLGALSIDTGSSTTQADVFAVDFIGGRYAQITNTPLANEYPAAFDGG